MDFYFVIPLYCCNLKITSIMQVSWLTSSDIIKQSDQSFCTKSYHMFVFQKSLLLITYMYICTPLITEKWDLRITGKKCINWLTPCDIDMLMKYFILILPDVAKFVQRLPCVQKILLLITYIYIPLNKDWAESSGFGFKGRPTISA